MLSAAILGLGRISARLLHAAASSPKYRKHSETPKGKEGPPKPRVLIRGPRTHSYSTRAATHLFPQECLGLMGRSPADSNTSPYPERVSTKIQDENGRASECPPRKKQNYTAKVRVVLLFLLQSHHPRRGWECSNCSEGPRRWFRSLYQGGRPASSPPRRSPLADGTLRGA